MIKLAMYKGKGLIGNAVIRWWTSSPYSHCELCDDAIPNEWTSSSLMDGGVRTKTMTLNPDHWDVIDLPWASRTLLHSQIEDTAGESYSWLDLIRCQLLNLPINEKGASFCSDWCAQALGLPNPTMYSPRGLLELCQYLNAQHKAA